MEDSVAFAVATQQSHKLKKSPKGYGTPEGKSIAKAKYSKPRKSYTIGADPKGLGKKLQKQLDKKAEQLIDRNNPMIAEREERRALPWLLGGAVAGSVAAAQESMNPGHVGLGALGGALAMYAGSRMLTKPKVKEASVSEIFPSIQLDAFTDELQKIAAAPPGLASKALAAGKKAAGRYGQLLSGGAKKKPGVLGRIAGRESQRPVKTLTGIKELRASKPGSKARKEIGKVVATRGATAAVGGTLAVKGVKKHKKTERRQLGRAYVTGARDMYGQMNRRQG